MKVVTSDTIAGKKVLLRLDLDVPLKDGKVQDDFRLKAGLPTLKLCLDSASEVIIMGHIGRPEGKMVPELSVEPIYDWLKVELGKLGMSGALGTKLKLLENLRFEEGEEKGDLDYAKELASLGDIFVNEAFAAYHQAASTIVLPTLLPHFAGLRFFWEIRELGEVRENPKRPLVVIIGGAKIEDKLPVVEALAKIADYVLVGGKVAGELSGKLGKGQEASMEDGNRVKSKDTSFQLPDLNRPPSLYPTSNILISDLNEEGTDITSETVEKWKPIIAQAKMIVWNGPLGKVEEPKNFMTHEIANLVISSGAETILGGGDTIAYLGKLGLLERFSFVSCGGGAMLKFLETGTLPTIQVLE